jgi:hypothetical protein
MVRIHPDPPSTIDRHRRGQKTGALELRDFLLASSSRVVLRGRSWIGCSLTIREEGSKSLGCEVRFAVWGRARAPGLGEVICIVFIRLFMAGWMHQAL